MRTKALICAAGLLAAGVATSMAQGNVYSLNVVGYTVSNLVSGFHLVANPLSKDQTGTGLLISGVLSNQLPQNTKVFEYNGVGYNQFSYAFNKGTGLTNWTPDGPLDPGRGVWIQIPAGAPAQSVTFVGEVLQNSGNHSNPNLPAGAGFGLLGSQYPITGGITTDLKYQPKQNDKIYIYNGAGYNQFSYAFNKGTGLTNWTPSEPIINVGQGFWLQAAQAGSVWNQNFTVQ